MNLARVLEVALPDVPPLKQRQGFPRIHPRHVAREHIERDGPLMMVLVPNGPNCFFRFNPFMAKNLLPLGLKLAVKRGVLQQIVRRR